MNKPLAEQVLNAQSICIMTGSGVSAESGIPTFRDAQTGLWEQFKAEELATPQAFKREPQLVWKWYQWRRQLVADAQPNAAHTVITQLQQQLSQVNIITQNVDGLHQEAGSHNVIEFHGNIRNNKCNACSYVEDNKNNSTDIIPECPQCNIKLRPAVVWFGESIPEHASDLALQAAQECDIFFSIGTSSLVHPAAGLAELARSNNAIIIEINPNATPLSSRADHVYAESASTVLMRLGDELFGA